MITNDQMQPYDTALQTNAIMANKELMELIAKLADAPENVVKFQWPRIYNALVQKYGAIAATVAKEFYETARAKVVNLPGYDPQIYPYDPNISADTGKFLSDLNSGKTVEQAAATAGEMLHRRTYEAADNTLAENAKADPAHPKMRLVPHPGACAWCGLLAMREWDYDSNQPIQRHGDCKCIVIVDFEHDPNYQNADKLLSPFQKAYEKVHTEENNRKWRQEFNELSKAEKESYSAPGKNPRDVYMRNRLLQEMNVALGNTKHTAIGG